MLTAGEMFLGSFVQGDQPNVVCPVCGFDYTHLKEIRTKQDAWQYTQLVMVFECEESHRFEVTIRQHKGVNHVDVRYPTNSEG
jgi:uncharacterized protein involved in propanediol utilization